jgi:hypothetical protein
MDFVTILNPAPHEVSNAGTNFAQAELKIGVFETDALVLITASGSANYVGPIDNAGITLAIQIDDKVVAEDESFEARSESMPFRSAASYNSILKKGSRVNISAKVTSLGKGGSSNTKTSAFLQCYALAIR